MHDDPCGNGRCTMSQHRSFNCNDLSIDDSCVNSRDVKVTIDVVDSHIDVMSNLHKIP